MSYAEKSVSKIRALDPEENAGTGPEPAAAPAPIVRAQPGAVEADYRRLLQKTPAILHSIDLEGRLVVVSDRWLEFMGYRREEVIGRRSADFLTEESRRKAVDEVLPAFMATGRCDNVAYDFVTKSGEVRNVLLSATAEYDAEGRMLCSLAVLTDVTDRVRTEQALAKSKARLRTILQDQAELICRYEADTTLTFVNEAFCRHFGKPEELLLGTAFADLFPEGARDALLSHISRLHPGQPVTYEQQSLTLDGQFAWHEWTDRAIARPDDGIVEYQSVARDITRSRRQQLALRRLLDITASQHQSLAEKIDEVILLGLDHFGLETGVVSEVRGSAYMVRHAASPIEAVKPGVSFALEDTYCAHTIEQGRPVAFDHVASSQLGRSNCYRKRRREAYIAAPIMVGGQLYGTLNFSARQPASRSFGSEDLEIVALLAQWLGLQILTGQKQAELERSNSDLEQFASVASHDLQEPLRTIGSFCELLQQRYAGQLDRDAEEFIGFIVDGAQRMQGLIDDLLSYSRAGTKGRDFEMIDSDAILDKALKNLKAALDRNDAVIEREPLPKVCADEVQVLQLFQNLIGNAVKFRAEDPLRITVTAEDQGSAWCFTVADNGIGIEPKFAERIFLVFQRLHTRETIEGSGIGLSICKKIVERHGGRIWVEPAEGRGSRFCFTLPKLG